MNREDRNSFLQRIVEHPLFSKGILAAIFLNFIIMILQTYQTVYNEFKAVFSILDYLFLLIFFLEMIIKLKVYKTNYFKDSWNIFDFIVVVSSTILTTFGASYITVVRVFRIFRVLRAISVYPVLREFSTLLAKSFKKVIPIMLFGILVFSAIAVFATESFRNVHPAFSTFHGSFFSVFQVSTFDGWSSMARTIMEDVWWAGPFFILVSVIGGFIILGLFVSAFGGDEGEDTDKILKSVAEMEKKLKIAEERAEKAEKMNIELINKVDILLENTINNREKVS